MTTREEIGLRIKNRREEMGISQKELAEELGYKNRSMISLIESGKRALDVDQMRPLAEILHCSVDDLIDDPERIDDELTELIRKIRKDPEMKRKAVQILQVISEDIQ